MTSLIFLVVLALARPVDNAPPVSEPNLEFIKTQWLGCFNYTTTYCKNYKAPDIIFDTPEFWKKEWDACIEAAINCENLDGKS